MKISARCASAAILCVAVLALMGFRYIGQIATPVIVGSSPITDITMDNTIYTGPVNGGDTLIGQIRSVPSNVTVNYTLSGVDAGKFNVVTGSAWHPTNRVDPTLHSSAAVQANGFHINIIATPVGIGGAFTKAFTIGAPPPPIQGTVIPVSTGNAQSVINGAAAGNTISFAPGTYSNLNFPNGLNYVSGTPESTGGTRATLAGLTVGTSNINVYGFNISGAAISVTGSNVNFTNNHMLSDPAFAPDSLSGSTFSWNTSDAGAFTAGGGASGQSLVNVAFTRGIYTNSAETLPLSPQGSNVNTNTSVTFNFISFGTAGIRFSLECASGLSSNGQSGWKFNDNYWLHQGLGNSIVSCGQFEEARNYFHNVGASANYGNEVACDACTSAGASVHDNYLDGRAATSGNNGGFYISDAFVHNFQNNNCFALSTDDCIKSNNTPNSTITGTTLNDLGVPSPFAAGAEP